MLTVFPPFVVSNIHPFFMRVAYAARTPRKGSVRFHSLKAKQEICNFWLLVRFRLEALSAEGTVEVRVSRSHRNRDGNSLRRKL